MLILSRCVQVVLGVDYCGSISIGCAAVRGTSSSSVQLRWLGKGSSEYPRVLGFSEMPYRCKCVEGRSVYVSELLNAEASCRTRHIWQTWVAFMLLVARQQVHVQGSTRYRYQNYGIFGVERIGRY
jgi:hypothetical protein